MSSKEKVCEISDSFEVGDVIEAERVQKLAVALEEIINPVQFMRERLEEGMQLNGMAAVQLAQDAEYLRDIAIAALVAYRGQGGEL